MPRSDAAADSPARDRSAPALAVRTERLGPLPLLNHVLERLKLPAFLEQVVPTPLRSHAVSYAKGLGVLLRSIIVEREPIYRQQETVRTFTPAAFGLTAAEASRLGDDQIGRALDRLFAADRGTLLTTVVVTACRAFALECAELHNDSTTVRFTGQYTQARGRSIRGRRAPFITYGHSKDRRPDLKQLLWILSTSTDGGVPVQFRCADGNTNDATTHLATWEALCQVAGRPDFLYVADSKLCDRDTMAAIDRRRGRLITVLPRSRREDETFRAWIQTHEPAWEEVWNRPHPRRQDGPRDIWRVCRDPLPSVEGWPVIWVWSALGALHQEQTRRERIARALQDLDALARKLAGPRPRRRAPAALAQDVQATLTRLQVGRYLHVRLVEEPEHRYRQERRGRPGAATRYRRLTRVRLRLAWTTDAAAITYDQKTDGMYPLLTNDRTLTPRDVLEAHKRQPVIEKRFEQLKTEHELAPVLLKNEGRIEALFFLYFLALLVQALLEREIRRAMQREGIQELPLYPEERGSRRPTAEQILRLFSLLERHTVLSNGQVIQVTEPELTDLQKQVLHLLGVPQQVYRHPVSSQ